MVTYHCKLSAYNNTLCGSHKKCNTLCGSQNGSGHAPISLYTPNIDKTLNCVIIIHTKSPYHERARFCLYPNGSKQRERVQLLPFYFCTIRNSLQDMEQVTSYGMSLHDKKRLAGHGAENTTRNAPVRYGTACRTRDGVPAPVYFLQSTAMLTI